MGTMVSFKDYEGLSGFGISSQNEVDELNKALATGSQIATGTSATSGANTNSGAVLRVESLEATLRVITFTLQNVKFWKKIPKLPAYSTVEEYNLMSDYGGEGGAFTTEGELPQTADSSYERKAALVKFLGTTREVTHPATLVRPAHGNVIALETQNGAIWLVERLERALFAARSDISGTATSTANTGTAFDGVDRQLLDGVGITTPWATDPTTAAGNIVIDCRANNSAGGDFTEDILETATNTIVENYGVGTDLYLAPKAMSQLAKAFYPRERINLPYPTQGQVGLAVNSFISSAGQVDFNSDIFLRPGRNNGAKYAPSAASSSKAPIAPAAASDTTSVTGSDGKFTGGIAYYYSITAVNQYGESEKTVMGTPRSPTTAQHVEASITHGTASGDRGYATGYRVYRGTASNGSDAQFIFELPANANKSAATTFSDFNYYLPGCSRAYLFQNNMNNFSFRQLAPMMKIPLATIAASIRWMQLIYGTPIVYTPKKNVVFINVKDS